MGVLAMRLRIRLQVTCSSVHRVMCGYANLNFRSADSYRFLIRCLLLERCQPQVPSTRVALQMDRIVSRAEP
jgi:hypothetical protein